MAARCLVVNSSLQGFDLNDTMFLCQKSGSRSSSQITLLLYRIQLNEISVQLFQQINCKKVVWKTQELILQFWDTIVSRLVWTLSLVPFGKHGCQLNFNSFTQPKNK